MQHLHGMACCFKNAWCLSKLLRAGVTGIALALAGARVTMTDREHVLHLTRSNVEANCVGACSSRVQV